MIISASIVIVIAVSSLISPKLAFTTTAIIIHGRGISIRTKQQQTGQFHSSLEECHQKASCIPAIGTITTTTQATTLFSNSNDIDSFSTLSSSSLSDDDDKKNLRHHNIYIIQIPCIHRRYRRLWSYLQYKLFAMLRARNDNVLQRL